MTDLTVKELIDEALIKARLKHKGEIHGVYELNVAISRLEEAQMWYTRGRARQLGMFNPVDLDKK